MPIFSSNNKNSLADMLGASMDEQNRAQMEHQAYTPYEPAIPAREMLRSWAEGVRERSSPTGMLSALASEAKRFGDMPAEEMLGQFGPSGGALSGLVGHTVYHGSPHKFNKFDMSKIGTGEGAQAYGHGLYFAESPAVAKSYKMDSFGPIPDRLQGIGLSTKGLGKKQEQFIARTWPDLTPTEIKQAIELGKTTKPIKEGNFYKVDIPDESIPRMLDWDKPLSEQSNEVQAALQDTLNQLAPSVRNSATGQKLYEWLGKQDNASKFLAEKGIPGIRYLDAGSRTKGGTSNYVLFDDHLPRIIEQNGIPTGKQPWSKK